MGITVEQVEVIAEKLRALPPIASRQRVVSKQESIKMLTAEIAALQDRGYSLQQISELLTNEKLEIGAPTLKSYLQRCKAGRKKPPVKRRARPVLTEDALQKQPAGEVFARAQTIVEQAAAVQPQAASGSAGAVSAITRPDRHQI